MDPHQEKDLGKREGYQREQPKEQGNPRQEKAQAPDRVRESPEERPHGDPARHLIQGD